MEIVRTDVGVLGDIRNGYLSELVDPKCCFDQKFRYNLGMHLARESWITNVQGTLFK
jgi:hypothetical protein